jgi:type III secretion protein L
MVGYYRLNDFGFRLAAGAHVVPKADFTAIEEANALVAEAEARARAILAEAEAVYASEKQRGYDDGLKLAAAEAVERLLEENRVLEKGLTDLESDLTRLVTASVRKLIDGFDDAAKVEAVVRYALKQMRREKRAEIRVPSALYEHFRARVATITAEFPEVELIDVVEDPALARSQVIVETSIGRVDADLGGRLDELEALIRSAHAHASADELDAVARAHREDRRGEP